MSIVGFHAETNNGWGEGRIHNASLQYLRGLAFIRKQNRTSRRTYKKRDKLALSFIMLSIKEMAAISDGNSKMPPAITQRQFAAESRHCTA